MSITDDRWKQIVQEILDAYASTVEKLSDETLITMHREHLRLRADELAAITRTELDRRGAEERYRNGEGLIVMCCGCHRTRLHVAGEDSWEWVAEFVDRMPSGVSHGICPPCLKHYYPDEG